MLRFIGDIYALLFGNIFFKDINKCLFYLSSRGLGLFNFSSERVSGENYVQKKFISPNGSPIIFDVGANRGNWAMAALNRNLNAQLHVFEPNVIHYSSLEKIQGNIKINNVAVGDINGEMLLYDYDGEPGSEHASLLNGVIDNIHKKSAISHKVPIVTLDDYCDKNKITTIDMLKIDTEGFEYQVLLGANNILKNTKILQFEFNEMNTIGRIFFRDFFNLLHKDFTIYRILPLGLLEIKVYSPWHCEQFVFQNFLAVNRNA